MCATAIRDRNRLHSSPRKKLRRKPSNRCCTRSSNVQRTSHFSKHMRKKNGTLQDMFSQSDKETMVSQRFFQIDIGGHDTCRSIPSRSDETVPVARAGTSTFLLRSGARRNLLPDDDQFGRDFIFDKRSLHNLSDDISMDGDSTPKKEAMDFGSWRVSDTPFGSRLGK